MESRNHPFNHINLHHKHVWWPCVNIKLSGIRGRAYLRKVRGENSESVNHFELTKWYGCVDAQWHRNPQSVALVTTIEPKKVKYTKNASKQTKLAPHSQQVILCPINTGFTSSHWQRREGTNIRHSLILSLTILLKETMQIMITLHRRTTLISKTGSWQRTTQGQELLHLM